MTLCAYKEIMAFHIEYVLPIFLLFVLTGTIDLQINLSQTGYVCCVWVCVCVCVCVHACSSLWFLYSL